MTLSPSPAEESFLGTSTRKQGGVDTPLTAHEALRPLIYISGALGEATYTQVALVPSPHSEATVKNCTDTQDTLRPSASEQEAIGSTISEQGTLQLTPSTQECFINMPSLGGNGRHFHSIKVVSRKPVSRKYNLNTDPSDKEGFGTSANVELTSSPASKEPPKLQLLLR